MRQASLIALKSWGVVAAIGIALAVPVVTGIAVFADPIASDQAPEWISIGEIDRFPADGVPRSVLVRVPSRDSWVRLPDEEIGSTFLIRSPADGSVRAFQSTYHCGAQVEYDNQANQFVVPCWKGIRFATDGRRLHAVHEWSDLREIRPRIINGAVWIRRAEVTASDRS